MSTATDESADSRFKLGKNSTDTRPPGADACRWHGRQPDPSARC